MAEVTPFRPLAERPTHNGSLLGSERANKLKQANILHSNDIAFLKRMLEIGPDQRGYRRVPLVLRRLALDCYLRNPALCTYAGPKLYIHNEDLIRNWPTRPTKVHLTPNQEPHT